MVGVAQLKVREDITVLVFLLAWFIAVGWWNADVGKVCKSELIV